MGPSEKERRMDNIQSVSGVEPDVVPSDVGRSTPQDVPLSPTLPDVVKNCLRTSVGARLARGIIPHLAGCPVTKQSKEIKVEIFVTLLRLALEILSTNTLAFEQISHLFGTSPLSGDEGRAAFFTIMDRMLDDGDFNWGRVVAIYAFTGHISKQIYAKSGSTEAVNEYVSFLEQYVDENLEHRIRTSLCGWDSLPERFPEKPNIEKQIWTGLVGTIVGLGICSLALIAVR